MEEKGARVFRMLNKDKKSIYIYIREVKNELISKENGIPHDLDDEHKMRSLLG